MDLIPEIMPADWAMTHRRHQDQMAAAGVSPVGKAPLSHAINSHALKAHTGDWKHVGNVADNVLAGIAAKMKSGAA